MNFSSARFVNFKLEWTIPLVPRLGAVHLLIFAIFRSRPSAWPHRSSHRRCCNKRTLWNGKPRLVRLLVLVQSPFLAIDKTSP